MKFGTRCDRFNWMLEQYHFEESPVEVVMAALLADCCHCVCHMGSGNGSSFVNVIASYGFDHDYFASHCCDCCSSDFDCCENLDFENHDCFRIDFLKHIGFLIMMCKIFEKINQFLKISTMPFGDSKCKKHLWKPVSSSPSFEYLPPRLLLK